MMNVFLSNIRSSKSENNTCILLSMFCCFFFLLYNLLQFVKLLLNCLPPVHVSVCPWPKFFFSTCQLISKLNYHHKDQERSTCYRIHTKKRPIIDMIEETFGVEKMRVIWIRDKTLSFTSSFAFAQWEIIQEFTTKQMSHSL